MLQICESQSEKPGNFFEIPRQLSTKGIITTFDEKAPQTIFCNFLKINVQSQLDKLLNTASRQHRKKQQQQQQQQQQHQHQHVYVCSSSSSYHAWPVLVSSSSTRDASRASACTRGVVARPALQRSCPTFKSFQDTVCDSPTPGRLTISEENCDDRVARSLGSQCEHPAADPPKPARLRLAVMS